jgi:hypothetical protein
MMPEKTAVMYVSLSNTLTGMKRTFSSRQMKDAIARFRDVPGEVRLHRDMSMNDLILHAFHNA